MAFFFLRELSIIGDLVTFKFAAALLCDLHPWLFYYWSHRRAETEAVTTNYTKGQTRPYVQYITSYLFCLPLQLVLCVHSRVIISTSCEIKYSFVNRKLISYLILKVSLGRNLIHIYIPEIVLFLGFGVFWKMYDLHSEPCTTRMAYTVPERSTIVNRVAVDCRVLEGVSWNMWH